MLSLKKIVFFLKKQIIFLLRKLIYTILYLRISILRIRHFFIKTYYKSSFRYINIFKIKPLYTRHTEFHQSEGESNSLREIPLKNKYTAKGLFEWDSSDSTTKSRLIIVILGFIFSFSTVGIKLLYVATTEYSNGKQSINKNNYFRRDIVDRNGDLLAVNLPGASLFANPQKIIDPELSVKRLATVLKDIDQKKILSFLKSDKTFVWIKRDITPKEQQSILNLGIPGLDFEREQKRIYIYGNLLSHVLGYVGRDMEGLAGIEKFFNEDLMIDREIIGIDQHSQPLQLSLDVRVQNILSEEIDNIINKFKAKGAAGIIANPNNGEIIAMVSKPDFDPHNPSTQVNKLFNMATQGAYEMGSGMKALTMAIGFDTSVITIHDAYDLSYMKVNNFRVKDYHPLKGWHSVAEIFLNSSNIGVSQIMLEIGKNNLRDYLKKLGLLDRLQLELPETARPLFPAYSRWTDLNLVTMSYGYGISESPAHFVQAMIPVINGGIAYPLTLVKHQDSSKIYNKRIFKDSTSLLMRKLMRLVVSEGTGKKAEVNGYYVGGKTGTANKAVAGRYDQDKRISSFFAIMPASNPQFIMYIVVDEPKGIKESYGFAGGGWTAAPAVGAVFERLITLYGLKKLDDTHEEIQELTNIDYKIKNET